jgi:hypothetical protein
VTVREVGHDVAADEHKRSPQRFEDEVGLGPVVGEERRRLESHGSDQRCGDRLIALSARVQHVPIYKIGNEPIVAIVPPVRHLVVGVRWEN